MEIHKPESNSHSGFTLHITEPASFRKSDLQPFEIRGLLFLICSAKLAVSLFCQSLRYARLTPLASYLAYPPERAIDLHVDQLPETR